jgi:hypothetical protein
MFWDVLDPAGLNLLKKLACAPPVGLSYLAGGTALALLMGHRESVDFDWFTPEPFDPEILSRRMEKFGSVRVAETASGTFTGWIDHIRITWLYYPNPVLEPFVTTPEVPGLRIASLKDIGIMKWTALANRGSIKDFIDLFVLDRQGLTLKDLFPLLGKKYPDASINTYHMVKSLSWFEDAEKEPWPVLRAPIEWEDVKTRFLQIQRELFPLLG